jgi:hypothetical protein
MAGVTDMLATLDVRGNLGSVSRRALRRVFGGRFVREGARFTPVVLAANMKRIAPP